MKRHLEVLLGLLLVGVIAYCAWLALFESRIRNQPSKEALVKIHEELQLGDSKARVTEIYNRFKTDRTRFKPEYSSNTWRVGMPSEFGATDWILYLHFGTDGNLLAVAIRTSDGIRSHPEGAPGDKGLRRFPD